MMWGITIYHCWICYWNVHHLRENKGEKKGVWRRRQRALQHDLYVSWKALQAPWPSGSFTCSVCISLYNYDRRSWGLSCKILVLRRTIWRQIQRLPDSFTQVSSKYAELHKSRVTKQYQTCRRKKNNMYRFHEFPALKYVCQKSRHSPG